MSKTATRVLVFCCVAAAALVAVLLLTGGGSETTQEIENPIEISMTINYPEDAKRANVISTQKVDFNVEKNSTVGDAIQLYCNVENLPLDIDTTNNCVTSIDDVENDDATFMEWRFTLNGKEMEPNALDTVLHDGDEIKWNYVQDEEAAAEAAANEAASGQDGTSSQTQSSTQEDTSGSSTDSAA